MVPPIPVYALTRASTGENLALFLDESEAERARDRFTQVRGWFDLIVCQIEFPPRTISCEDFDRYMDSSARSK